MSRRYTLPARGADDREWCRKAAAAIPAELIAAKLLAEIMRRDKRAGKRYEAWSVLGRLLGHGSGVSMAVERRLKEFEEGGEGC